MCITDLYNSFKDFIVGRSKLALFHSDTLSTRSKRFYSRSRAVLHLLLFKESRTKILQALVIRLRSRLERSALKSRRAKLS